MRHWSKVPKTSCYTGILYVTDIIIIIIVTIIIFFVELNQNKHLYTEL